MLNSLISHASLVVLLLRITHSGQLNLVHSSIRSLTRTANTGLFIRIARMYDTALPLQPHRAHVQYGAPYISTSRSSRLSAPVIPSQRYGHLVYTGSSLRPPESNLAKHVYGYVKPSSLARRTTTRHKPRHN